MSALRPRVLDLFCGAGGSSWGAQHAGCEIVAGVDAWDIAASTFSSNFGEGKGINLRLDGRTISAEVKALGDVDLLLASPECTNHTCARGNRPRDEKSRMTAWQVIHHARVLQPRWIVVENVVHMESWHRYDRLLEELHEDLKYDCFLLKCNAAEFGVPQTRRRLFIVATRDGQEAPPGPPHRKGRSVREILDRPGMWPVNPLVTPRRAKPTLQRAERAMRELGRREPFLIVYYGSDAAGGWQSLDRPLRTLTTLDRFALVEPSRGGHTIRMLQVPELRRAMGFHNNDGFELPFGTRRDRIKLLGNGVCPPVMQHIVAALIRGAQRTLISPTCDRPSSAQSAAGT